MSTRCWKIFKEKSHVLGIPTEAIMAAIALLFVALYSITMLNFTESVILVGQYMAAPAVLMGIAMAKLEHDRLTWSSRED